MIQSYNFSMNKGDRNDILLALALWKMKEGFEEGSEEGSEEGFAPRRSTRETRDTNLIHQCLH